jgi:hypothetical protein
VDDDDLVQTAVDGLPDSWETFFFVKFYGKLIHEVYFIFCLALLEPYTMTATIITSCSKPRSQEE